MTAKNPIKLFVTGATGYIGGSVLTKILQSASKGKYNTTVFTRSEASVPKFKELGVTPLMGDLDSADILRQAAGDSDAVLHLAHADHWPAARALVDGLNTNDGKRRLFIHNSGAGILADEAMGNYAAEKIYNDLDIETIHNIPLTQPHKDIEDYIFKNSTNYDPIIVCPPTIFGVGSGPFNRYSKQLPLLIKGFLKAGKAGTLGKGLSRWSHIHVDDLSSLYVFLLEKALEGKADTGYNGFYFSETGEHAWKDITAKIAEELYKNKAITSPDVTEFTNEEVETFLGKKAPYLIGSNSRSRSKRAGKLGWKPNESNPTIFEHIEQEVKIILEAQKNIN